MKPILNPARPKSLLSPHMKWVREGSGNWRGLAVFREELGAHLVLQDTEHAAEGGGRVEHRQGVDLVRYEMDLGKLCSLNKNVCETIST